MASQYRIRNYRPGELVHLTCRGFRRQRIFLDEDDHAEFEATFRKLNDRLPREDRLLEHAEGRMPNHQHRFVGNGQSPSAITKVMHSLKVRYAQYFNWRYNRHGPVFEKPFRGKVIRGGAYIANTFSYIHQNPDSSMRIDSSSHGVYIGAREDPYIDTSLAWRIFGGQGGYIEFFSDSERVRQARLDAQRRFGA